MRGIKWTAIVAVVIVTAGCALRPALGRSRADLAALLSFDEGPLTFSRAYTTGKVGPFVIGDTRSVTIQRLTSLRLLEQDKAQLNGKKTKWRIALPAPSGGYTIYTLVFEGEQLATVRAFYSLFAGL